MSELESITATNNTDDVDENSNEAECLVEYSSTSSDTSDDIVESEESSMSEDTGKLCKSFGDIYHQENLLEKPAT